MDKYTIAEISYKNGYENGYEAGKRDVMARYKLHTNAERIRNMDNKGLADFLWRFNLKDVAREDDFLVTKEKLEEWLEAQSMI